MIRAVVFDLDRTLVGTDGLEGVELSPRSVLARFPLGGDGSPTGHSGDPHKLPSLLIQRGFRVVLFTRGSLAYASTLLEILDIDCDWLADSVDSAPNRRQQQLQRIVARGSSADETLYVGARLEDEEIAREVGCQFERAAWITGGEVGLSKLPEEGAGRSQGSSDYLKGTGHKRSIRRCLAAGFGLDVPAMEDLRNLYDLEERSGLAGLALAARPNQQFRGELQRMFLDGLGPGDADCVVNLLNGSLSKIPIASVGNDSAIASLDPRLITRHEIWGDVNLRDRYVDAMARIFPARRVSDVIAEPSGANDPVVLACMPFHTESNWGRMLSRAKDWRHPGNSRRNGISGPDVRLGLGWIIEGALAGTLRDRFGHVTVVPVPSSRFSPQQPAQFSERLAHRAGLLAGLPVRSALVKRRDGGFSLTAEAEGLGDIVLLDDQLTNGDSMRRAWDAPWPTGVNLMGGACWSASKQIREYRPRVVCYWDRPSELAGVLGPCIRHRTR